MNDGYSLGLGISRLFPTVGSPSREGRGDRVGTAAILPTYLFTLERNFQCQPTPPRWLSFQI
jgi:hypothetical protein